MRKTEGAWSDDDFPGFCGSGFCDTGAASGLGEYSALVAAGALDFKTAVALVAKRGSFMEEAAPAGSGKMVAVLNAEVSLIEAVCQEASAIGVVSPANYNTPSQIVIGGEVAAVDKAVELLKDAGVKRLIPLNVSGPFHTALLRPAVPDAPFAARAVRLLPLCVREIRAGTAPPR